jgi:predicted DNA-binding transcriptional regulator AlpA
MAVRHQIAAFVPVLEVFSILGVHANTGYHWIQDGDFPIEVVLIGKRYFCRRGDVESFITGEPSA